MRSPSSPIFILIVSVLSTSKATLCIAQQSPAAYYMVYQWPGLYRGAKHDCCYPKTGKVQTNEFKIGGIWPYTFLGDRLTHCTSKTHFSFSKMSNLTKSLEKNWPSLSCPSSSSAKLWKQEWKKYGTCSESLFGGQYQYFNVALKLKNKVDVLKILTNAGIHPIGSFYSLNEVVSTIQKAVTYLPGIICNEDKSGDKQLYQILMCGDNAGTRIDDCLGIPGGNCTEKIKFPPFKLQGYLS